VHTLPDDAHHNHRNKTFDGDNHMRMALMSDIHSNWHALQACLQDAAAQGVQQYAFLGDLVGYGGEPEKVMDSVMTHAQQGAVVLQGNHDALAVKPSDNMVNNEDASARWTHERLSDEQRRFLRALPYTAQIDSCWLVHASAHHPESWQYVKDERSAAISLDAALAQNPSITHVFGGHVHEQTLYFRGTARSLMAFKPTAGVPIPTPAHRQWIATIGSVGQPRDGDPRAAYAVMDTERMQLMFRRVPYEHAQAAAAIRAGGLPEYFAKRLESGR
jgi:diadenosine tetraphosphatase ApaH/serine/threonine PP2A family protein phosphatase